MATKARGFIGETVYQPFSPSALGMVVALETIKDPKRGPDLVAHVRWALSQAVTKISVRRLNSLDELIKENQRKAARFEGKRDLLRAAVGIYHGKPENAHAHHHWLPDSSGKKEWCRRCAEPLLTEEQLREDDELEQVAEAARAETEREGIDG
jgi:hypothetical protein